MQDFIGRKRELDVLESAYQSDCSGFIPIYGRRRVGKSELILQFLQDKPGIYVLGKKAQPGLQIREFLSEAAAVLDEPLLDTFPPENWRSALDAVVGRSNHLRKLVIVLDEFQWMVQASPELPGILQECWDRRWKDNGRVLLLLSGSYIGFMEREVLGSQSPLFGRRTAQIQLKPFGYRDAARFHPSASLVDRAKIYFICGGIPLYLRYFLSSRSVEMNIAATLLNEFAPLFNEPDFLLREELREVQTYYAILMAIAFGAITARAISQQTGIGERALQYYLKQLIELGYVARRYPVTGETPATRHVRYVLEDPLLRFWFRFIYPNVSFILQMGPQRAIGERIRPYLDSYFGLCFERLCREALPDLYARENVPVDAEIGEYWDKTTQIDVVAFRRDGWIDLGECKWGEVRYRKAIEDDLAAKVALYPNPSNATIGRRIFTRQRVAGTSSQAAEIRWHALEDLYAADEQGIASSGKGRRR